MRKRLMWWFAAVALLATALTTWMTMGLALRAARQVITLTQNIIVVPDTRSPRGNGWFDNDTHDAPPWAEGFGWQNRKFFEDPNFALTRGIVQSFSRNAMFAGLLSFGLAALAAFLLTRRLTRPLTALADGARRLSSGERNLRLALPKERDELRTVTEAFNQLSGSLEEQEAWRRNMVADIAHDLRTPLAVMRAELEAMQDGVQDLDDEAVGRLHHEVLMLAQLVENLRTLSVAEGGGLQLKPLRLPLRSWLLGQLETLRPRADAAGMNFVLDADPALSVQADPLQLARVMSNLIVNALRYAAPGSVEVQAQTQTKDQKNGISITVRDHGPGLPPEALERVFERFYRADQSRSRREGSGLGLAIARAIVQAHGGKLEAHNHAGGGAVFSVWLPNQG